MCIRGDRTFNRHIVDPIKDANNHVTINILHGMAWLGRINGPVPIVRLVYGGFLPHAKLEIRSSHFPLSVARTQNRE